jgi:hypothetical protein
MLGRVRLRAVAVAVVVAGAAAFVVLAAAACTEPELILPPPKPRLTPEAAPDGGASTGPRTPAARSHASLIDSDADLLLGVEADGKRGDLRLENARAIFIIDGAGSALGFADSGGNLIDAAPRVPRRAARDSLKQLITTLGHDFPRQALYELVVPGQRGTSALVRAVGHDSRDPRIQIDTEYVLDADASALRIETKVTNGGDQPLSGYAVGDAIQWGRAERFTPGSGFERPPRDMPAVAAGWIAGLGEDATYVYVAAKTSTLTAEHGGGWSDTAPCTLELAAGATGACVRWLAALAPNESIGDAVAALRGEKWPRVEGHVREEGTTRPVGGARVFVEDHGKPVALAQSDAGAYVAAVPPGDYDVRAAGVGRRGPAGVPVRLRGDEAKTVDMLLSQPGALRFRVTEGGKPSPAKLSFFQPEHRVHLGPAFASPGGNVALTVTGEGRVVLAPGKYDVLASRGPEFTVEKKTITVPAGGEVEADFTLARAVDARGLLCVDLHQHALPSPDSGVSLTDRAASNLAEGMDVIVPTDHNALAEWQPTLDALGAARPVKVVLGDEATLDGLGHWNAYPVAYRRDAARGGALDVRGLDAHQIIGGLRAPDRVVQVNHPRFRNIGYFNNVQLDSKPGAALPADWEGGFDAIEVFSANDVAGAAVVLRDWFELLDRGFEYTAVGGSDAHLVNGGEVGYPRTCVTVPEPQPADAGPALVDGIKRRRDAFVTNGPFVRVQVAGHGMGQLAPAARGRARLDVEVQAAPWVDARHVEVIVNGERRGKPLDLPAPQPGQPLRWKGSIELKLTEDSYVVVQVRGEQPLAILRAYPDRPPPTPFAVTNPIFLDRDLDGKYIARRAPSRAK